MEKKFMCRKCKKVEVDEWEYRWGLLQCKKCGDEFIIPKIKDHYWTVFYLYLIIFIVYLIFGANDIVLIFLFFIGLGVTTFFIINSIALYTVLTEQLK